MATVIMRNNGHLPFIVKPTLLSICLAMSGFAYADFRVQPSLAVDTHGYHIREDNGGIDRGASLSVSPTLDLFYNSSVFSSALQVQNQSVVYRDSQRDDVNYFTYNSGNSLRMLNDNLGVDLRFSQDYRSSATSASRFQDQIN